MSTVIIVPLAILAALLVCVITFGPSVWLTRSSRALRLRRMPGQALAAAWIVAAIPWTAVLLYLHYRQHFAVSADSIPEFVGAIIVTIVLIALLLSLPLGVLILSIMRLLDRKIIGTR
ncbi:MAG: hypothetical protein ABI026_03855 [Gemmatimonadaceae bacterium]